MTKNFQEKTYIVDDNLTDTLTWLLHHQDCYDRFYYDAIRKHPANTALPSDPISLNLVPT